MTTVSVPSIARELLDKHQNTNDAASALEARARKNQELYEALTEHHLRDACLLAVRKVAMVDRKSLWSGQQEAEPPAEPKTSRKAAADRFTAWAGSNARGFLHDYRTRSGQRLGLADRDELHETIAFMEPRAMNMLEKVHWLRMIAQRLPDGKIVEDAFSEEDIAAMRAEVRIDELPVAAE